MLQNFQLWVLIIVAKCFSLACHYIAGCSVYDETHQSPLLLSVTHVLALAISMQNSIWFISGQILDPFSYILSKETYWAFNCRTCPAVVAWFVKASVFHSVNSAPSANGGSNPAWECCFNCLNLKEFVTIQIARCRVLFRGFTIQAPGVSC